MKVVVIDYGMCNLLSVYNALKHIGAKPLVTPNPDDVKSADLLILPGVGAFEDGMNGLRKRGFLDPIHQYVAGGRPLLGICLGMQFLMDKSYEFGEHKGLGLISGEVTPLPKTGMTGMQLKIPHIGWNSLLKTTRDWDGTLLSGLPSGIEMYFVHSFQVVPSNKKDILAETDYGGHHFCSVVARENVYGCQFHPEKSSIDGLKILENFILLKGEFKNG